MEFEKRYDAKSAEPAAYERWEAANAFAPRPGTTGKTFYIPIPPPNVTSTSLHVGHVAFLTLQDIMTRYHRMLGDETLWLPGTDHASIAAQAIVEKNLAKEGKTRRELGREKFLEEMWAWMDKCRPNITGQMKLVGSSLDWSRERFTLDDGLSKIVRDTFIRLYEEGLIYRGDYMVNYSPALESVISDIEVDYREEEGKMYYITYFVSGSDKELTVATTRPETLLADQAVAVHPKDKRFKKLIGRSVILPIVNKEIPIVADDMVDMEFGTGAVKITPAHDPVDFETGRRHGLRLDYAVVDKMGRMNENAGIFAGQDVLTARENIVELLKSKGNLEKVEPHMQRVGYCSRGGCRVETVVSTQWFVRASEMAKKVIAGYETKEFEIIPDRFGKVFEDWIYNLRDWCISRQLWWGHRIPAYYHADTHELLGVTADPTELYTKYGQDKVVQDEDTLDTWYSSAMWPFGVLDWSLDGNHGDLYKKFYPAQVLETGYDILFFWVIRMLLMGYHFTGQTPFKTIYLHGLVTDEKGRKMSKSWGNVIDPLEVLRDHSADSMRMTVSIGSTPGNNIAFSMRSVEANSLFLTKLWNIARFVTTAENASTADDDTLEKTLLSRQNELLDHERWILSRLSATIESVTKSLDGFDFSPAGETVMKFARDEYADFFIEECKHTKDESKLAPEVLRYVLINILRLAHPFIPFVTETLHERMSGSTDLLILSAWPKAAFARDEVLEGRFETLEKIIRTVRSYRASANIPPKEYLKAFARTHNTNRTLIESNKTILMGMLRLESLEFVESIENESDYAYLVVEDIDLYVENTSGSQDNSTEIARLETLIEDKKSYVKILDQKLLNPNFTRSAPEKVVRMELEKKREAEEQIAKLKEKLEKLSR
ncbi:MAG TPA: valine--tRNA ligase [bacterium]|nr:valine--tRNA ligase [bacterium]